MIGNFNQLFMPNQIIYGPQSFQTIGKQVASLGKKALIISDPIMEQIGNVLLCENYLKNKSIPFAKYLGVKSEPTDIYVAEAIAVCREEECDVIVAVGGGSCIDTAKAVAVMMTNEGYIWDYVGNNKDFSEKPLPLIAVPTTAGTGSEVTKVTVIINTKTDVKMMLSKPELMPAVAIVDPILTLSCPPPVTAATGIDALCHAVEAYISKRAHPVTDTLALTAIDLIVRNLRRAYQNGDDIEARDQVALGSMLAGAAFSNSSVTLVHGMSRPIGALFHVPHGVSNAMLLPAVLEFTKDHAIERLADIGRILLNEHNQYSDGEIAEQAISEIKKLCRDLNIPNMNTWGLDKKNLDKVVLKMATDALASGSPGNNPKVPSHEDIVQLYHICYDYDFGVMLPSSCH